MPELGVAMSFPDDWRVWDLEGLTDPVWPVLLRGEDIGPDVGRLNAGLAAARAQQKQAGKEQAGTKFHGAGLTAEQDRTVSGPGKSKS